MKSKRRRVGNKSKSLREFWVQIKKERKREKENELMREWNCLEKREMKISKRRKVSGNDFRLASMANEFIYLVFILFALSLFWQLLFLPPWAVLKWSDSRYVLFLSILTFLEMAIQSYLEIFFHGFSLHK